MKLTPEEIQNLADLSRLDPAEVEKVEADLESILGYVAQIQTVETKGVEPLKRITDQAAPGRDDTATNPATAERRSELLGNKDGEIRVPAVFEGPSDA